jgi:hypothetical protein
MAAEVERSFARVKGATVGTAPAAVAAPGKHAPGRKVEAVQVGKYMLSVRAHLAALCQPQRVWLAALGGVILSPCGWRCVPLPSFRSWTPPLQRMRRT